MVAFPRGLELMAGLFEYPTAEYQERVRSVTATLAPINAPAVGLMTAFARAIADRSLSEMEELYIQTFDLNPDACLDIGWHLFGEDYARGEFLLKLRQEMRRYGVLERDELPDSLLCVLPLAARLPEREAADFCARFLLPAVEKIRKAVPMDSNPLATLLAALASLLTGQVTGAAQPEARSDE